MTEQLDRTEESRACRPLIEVVTENGFGIVRFCDMVGGAQGSQSEYKFIVRHPDGLDHQVIVTFDCEALAIIQRTRRIPLPADNSFWIACAERSLATYLLERNQLPPDGKLILKEMCLAELEIARRWGVERETDLSRRFLILLAPALLALTFSIARAQQTVFNVPTTDVLPAEKVYVEMDISVKPNDSLAVSHFSSFVPRLVVGVGHGVEVGVNLTGNIQPGADRTTIVPATKWKIYDGKENSWAIVIGDNLYIPIHNKIYNFGTYAYVMTQKTFKQGTRVGFGGNFFTRNVVAPNANRAGGQFTFEQPITKKLSFDTDWFTGKHANGYVTTGGAYKFTNKFIGFAAYSIGNSNASHGNQFMYLELGYNIN